MIGAAPSVVSASKSASFPAFDSFFRPVEASPFFPLFLPCLC
jgi:hypothetical protein